MKIIALSFLVLFLNACATPHVVSVIGPNDSTMNCTQLDSEIAIASNYKRDAKKKKVMELPLMLVLSYFGCQVL